jgi:hypothetical protein
VKLDFESDEVKKSIVKSFKEFRMKKATLWNQKKRMEQADSFSIYNNIKRYFAQHRGKT